MKSEPLKDKIQTYICPLEGTSHWKFFKDTDVKSAVEWLKERIHRPKVWRKEHVESLIDEAFEDVIKNDIHRIFKQV